MSNFYNLIFTAVLLSVLSGRVLADCSNEYIDRITSYSISGGENRNTNFSTINSGSDSPSAFCEVSVFSRSGNSNRIDIRNDGRLILNGKSFSILPSNGSLETIKFQNEAGEEIVRFSFNSSTYMDIELQNGSFSFSPNLNFDQANNQLRPNSSEVIVLDYGNSSAQDIDNEVKVFTSSSLEASCTASNSNFNDFWVRADGREVTSQNCGITNEDLIRVGFFLSTDTLNWIQRSDVRARADLSPGQTVRVNDIHSDESQMNRANAQRRLIPDNIFDSMESELRRSHPEIMADMVDWEVNRMVVGNILSRDEYRRTHPELLSQLRAVPWETVELTSFNPTERARYESARIHQMNLNGCREAGVNSTPMLRVDFESNNEYRSSAHYDEDNSLPKNSVPKYLEYSSRSSFQRLFAEAGCENIDTSGLQIDSNEEISGLTCSARTINLPLSEDSMPLLPNGVAYNPNFPPGSVGPEASEIEDIYENENLYVRGSTRDIPRIQPTLGRGGRPPLSPSYQPVMTSLPERVPTESPLLERMIENNLLTEPQISALRDVQACRIRRSRGIDDSCASEVDQAAFTRQLELQVEEDSEGNVTQVTNPLFRDARFNIERGVVTGLGGTTLEVDRNFLDFLNSEASEIMDDTNGRTVIQQCLFEANGSLNGQVSTMSGLDINASGIGLEGYEENDYPRQDPINTNQGRGVASHSLFSCHSVGRALDIVGGIRTDNGTIGGRASNAIGSATYRFRLCWHNMNRRRCGLSPNLSNVSLQNMIGSIGSEDSRHSNHLHLSMPLCSRLNGHDSRRREPTNSNAFFCPK